MSLTQPLGDNWQRNQLTRTGSYYIEDHVSGLKGNARCLSVWSLLNQPCARVVCVVDSCIPIVLAVLMAGCNARIDFRFVFGGVAGRDRLCLFVRRCEDRN